MPIAEIANALSAITGIKTISDGLISVRDQAKLMEAKLALMTQLFEIRQALDALQDQLSAIKQAKAELERENLELKTRLDRVGDNEPLEVSPGVYVSAAKPVNGQRAKPPYYCQTCHSDGKQSLLSFKPPTFEDFDPGYLVCPTDPRHNLELPNRTTPRELGFGS